ncbi:P-loop containing nucleoside triphosphate hydrolase protein [Trametes punicea]|nr:P-loop containing nucleoside triphosphate hydrolase protein [Trametes punicea]
MVKLGAKDIYSSLSHFLPAGTVTLDIPSLAPSSFTGGVELAEDGWRTFPKVVVGFRDDGSGIDRISFLVCNRFIAATYHINTAHMQLFVRIYVIPWDLPGSRGELRSRDESILKLGCNYLRTLFLKIRKDRSLWEGDSSTSQSPCYFMDGTPDNRTLLDIYNTLPSPSAPPLEGTIPGLRTKLYEYQQRSVAAMVARETNRGSIEHPLYVPIEGINGKLFFLQPATMEILSERPRVSAIPGGILCEELGTGKTIMILSLVLATFDTLASPEEQWYEERPPLTPLALRNFRTPSVMFARDKLAGRRKRFAESSQCFPSLVEIILHKCRVAPEGTGLREPEAEEILERHRLWKPYTANVPFYLQSQPPSEALSGRRARQQESLGPRVMYLTSATLIIVPDNLRRQWANEILKHCTDLLRVYLVDDKQELPDAPILATDFDIILMSQSRFSQESKKKNVESLYSWTVCECMPRQDTLLRRCKCSRREDVSPLLQIRWKRLVIDEGHYAAEKRTDYAIFTKLLSVERRWIVTGTPTTNLLGLNLGSGSELQYPGDDEEIVQSSPQRVWPAEERVDLRNIGNMLTDFLMMMPFAADPKAFSRLVTNPLFRPSGPYPGDVDVLAQVMSSVMVRHRIEDVESEVRLAFLDHKTVMLDMDPLAVKTYNVIQAIIAVNAVDSERQHQDYLFHPRNVAHLQELVSNLSHVPFWHVVASDHEEHLTNAHVALRNLEKRNGGPEDFKLLSEALFHLQSAVDDPVWRALQTQYHVFHRINKMPSLVYDAWSVLPQVAREACPIQLLPPDVLVQLRQSVTQRPLSSAAKIAEMGNAYRQQQEAYKEILRLQERSKKRSTRDRQAFDEGKPVSSPSKQVERTSAKEKMEEMKREMDAALARYSARYRSEDAENATLVQSNDLSQRMVASSLLRLSPVADVRIRNSTSTKLDYILNEVLTYGAEDKFLIFSESSAKLAFVAEAFDLCKIKYLSFSGQHTREERQSIIMTFETSELYRVLLLELKHGARGLNLVSASRVIFCEPVWKADVESQAIKRVHRIGQTKPVVHVTTLAIKSTFEEVIVARSKAIQENKQEATKAAMEDRTVRDFIANPTFLPVPTGERLVNLDIPLFDILPPPSAASARHAPSASSMAIRIAEPVHDSARAQAEKDSPEPPRKKQRRVAFAE